MPRLSPQLFHRAKHIHPLLPLILRTTRDLRSAQNELRWLKEHASANSARSDHRQRDHTFRKLCYERGRGRPLQYLLGSEYFADLEIICRPGVLIPRQETAASICHLSKRLTRPPDGLRVLDLCTGTGCIPLLFQHEYRRLHSTREGLQVLGIDVSPKALCLARANLGRQQEEQTRPIPVDFAKADIFTDGESATDTLEPTLQSVLQGYDKDAQRSKWDILISNPPYISPYALNHTTSRSVRNFEPRLALVPEKQYHMPDVDPGDVFYPRLLKLATTFGSKIVLFEVADMDQGQRVATMIQDQGIWAGVEIWRDDPEHNHLASSREETSAQESPQVRIVGSGNGRSVFAWRHEASEWLGAPAKIDRNIHT